MPKLKMTPELAERAEALRERGWTYRQISNAFAEDGIDISDAVIFQRLTLLRRRREREAARESEGIPK